MSPHQARPRYLHALHINSLPVHRHSLGCTSDQAHEPKYLPELDSASVVLAVAQL